VEGEQQTNAVDLRFDRPVVRIDDGRPEGADAVVGDQLGQYDRDGHDRMVTPFPRSADGGSYRRIARVERRP
jgi:hypothetical protein